MDVREVDLVWKRVATRYGRLAEVWRRDAASRQYHPKERQRMIETVPHFERMACVAALLACGVSVNRALAFIPLTEVDWKEVQTSRRMEPSEEDVREAVDVVREKREK